MEFVAQRVVGRVVWTKRAWSPSEFFAMTHQAFTKEDSLHGLLPSRVLLAMRVSSWLGRCLHHRFHRISLLRDVPRKMIPEIAVKWCKASDKGDREGHRLSRQSNTRYPTLDRWKSEVVLVFDTRNYLETGGWVNPLATSFVDVL